ncbi:MAG: ABC transporter ATP-binding protein [Rhizobiaceae bacterium]|nr:ABC transporter ATP-binding protein [Rhizobiaceae bacterium]MBL4696951.1 ABC transporter ATP-binding protein [Rhizobiaceae bacterium]
MAALLEITSLRKSFGGVTATDDVNLKVEKGELHAIIGPNGAGKTTLISQLSGALRPDSGSIVFQGENITNRPAYSRARLGITRSFQITSLIMSMTVLDNVALAIQARDKHSFRFLKPARDIEYLREEGRELLAQFGLDGRADEPTVALSHGEHRQIEIAVALASKAELMLLDEPMAGLGPTESTTMIEFLKDLKGKRTILLIEHDMDAVFALADRISVLVYGHIIATGTPDEIRSNDDVRHAYLGEE